MNGSALLLGVVNITLAKLLKAKLPRLAPDGEPVIICAQRHKW
jgi:hypothetical protein